MFPTSQIPDKSVWPSGSRGGAGAERLGFPSGRRGIPGVGRLTHCAWVAPANSTRARIVASAVACAFISVLQIASINHSRRLRRRIDPARVPPARGRRDSKVPGPAAQRNSGAHDLKKAAYLPLPSVAKTFLYSPASDAAGILSLSSASGG